MRSVVRGVHSLPICLALTLLALPPARAAAFEDQGTLSVELGYGQLVGSALPAHGLLAGATFAVGLDDAVTLRLGGAYALHPGGGGPLHVAAGYLEALYIFDILEIVPYGGIGLGGLLEAIGAESALEATAHVVVGAEYLLDRAWSLGLDLRALLKLTELEGDPIYVQVTLRAGYSFDL